MLGLGNSINSIDFPQPASGGGGGGSKMLDTFSGATAAYSLRQLSSSYSGNCVLVRRASDDAELNIGFSGGELDTSALATHCGSSDGFVVTWYDQSGNSNNATQSTAANQPRIYDGSGPRHISENGKPAIEFDGSGDHFDLSISGLNINNMSVHTVSRPNPSGTSNDAGHTLAAAGAVYWIHFIQRVGSVHKDRFFYGSSLDTGVDVDNNQHLYSFIAGSTAGFAAMYRDGTKISADLTLTSQSSNSQEIGAFIGGITFEGTKQEFIVYGSDTTNSRTNIESNINTFYSIF
tara:strand:+ start:511 stop:1383 length:873 start_codon:yes stop_codon:yes gene_type:complete